MEKLVYILQKPENVDLNDWQQQLLNTLLPELSSIALYETRLLVPDQQVVEASGLVQANIQPLADALVTCWLDTHLNRNEVDQLIQVYAQQYQLHLVLESVPLYGEDANKPDETARRLPGFTQVAFLKRPEQLSEEQWLDIWQHSHTQIAIDIQSNYRYVQNRVIQNLVGGHCWDAIVTESFPARAMSDMTAFYDCEGDEALMQQRVGQMIESCARFIDFSLLNILPCSEYGMKGR